MVNKDVCMISMHLKNELGAGLKETVDYAGDVMAVEKAEPVAKAEGEEGAEAAPEEGADGDKPKEEWKKENFTWSKTDKKSMNLPPLFTHINVVCSLQRTLIF